MYWALIITQFYPLCAATQLGYFKPLSNGQTDRRWARQPWFCDANSAGNPARSMAQTQSQAGTAGPIFEQSKPPGPWVRPSELPPILPTITRKVGEDCRPPTRVRNAYWSPQPSVCGGDTGGAEGPSVIKREVGCRPRTPPPRISRVFGPDRPPYSVCLRREGAADFPREACVSGLAATERPVPRQPGAELAIAAPSETKPRRSAGGRHGRLAARSPSPSPERPCPGPADKA